MMTYSRHGRLHPWVLDGKQFRRGYTSGNFITRLRRAADRGNHQRSRVARVHHKWLLNGMHVYPASSELGEALSGLLPAVAAHVVAGRFETAFASPPKEQAEIATLRWRRPPWNHSFQLTDHLENAPPCNEVLSNSLLWDPLGNQWGRNGHWSLIATYGTTRYPSKGMEMRREVAAERRWERRQAPAQGADLWW